MQSITLRALRAVEKYLVDRGIEHRGTTGRTWVLPLVREAIEQIEAAPLDFEAAFRQTDVYRRVLDKGVPEGHVFERVGDRYRLPFVEDCHKLWLLAGGK